VALTILLAKNLPFRAWIAVRRRKKKEEGVRLVGEGKTWA